jgi:hypothetical protein
MLLGEHARRELLECKNCTCVCVCVACGVLLRVLGEKGWGQECLGVLTVLGEVTVAWAVE